MEDIQQRFRDQLDEMKRVWQPRLGMTSTAPKYNFSRLAAVQRIARGVTPGRNKTRVETLYEHLQDEINTLRSQAAENEYPMVLFSTGQGDAIQVGSIGFRNPDLIIFDGLDESNQRTRILAQAGAVQLTMKIVTVAADAPKPEVDFLFTGLQGEE